ncbi:MAG: L-dopachrome tautomerase-related protein [Janthinobacterium lividum]
MRLRTTLALACLLLPAPLATFAQRNNAAAPTDKVVGNLETVATFNGPMPTGVTVSRSGRIFVNFPRWGDDVPFTVAEVVKGKAVAFPNAEVNDWAGRSRPNPNAYLNEADNQTHFVSVQSVVVDPEDRLWVLDTGAPLLKSVVPGGAKMVCIDLASNKIIKTILLPPETAGPNSYMNDVRFDLRKGQSGPQDPQTAIGSSPAPNPDAAPKDAMHPVAERKGGQASADSIRGTAYITDSSSQGPNALIVVDLATGKSFRRLNQHSSVLAEDAFLMFAEGQPVYQTLPGYPPVPVKFAVDGIAISADGSLIYYCPINSTNLYAVSADALRDRSKSESQVEATVRVVAGKMPSDGLESDANGAVYLTDPVTNSVHRWNPGTGLIDTLAHDPRLLWPDTMSVAADGYLYVTANQLHRQPTMHNGQDMRVKPYQLFRIKIDAQPVSLK